MREWLRQRFERVDDVDFRVLNLQREIARHIFEFIRNLIIVGGLKYLADKTGSAFLQVGYSVSLLALAMFVSWYTSVVNLRVFSGQTRNGAIGNLIVNVLISAALFVGSILVISNAVAVIAQGQAK